MPDTPDWGASRYREALLGRGRSLGIDPRVRVRFDVDDLVNETLTRAVAAQTGASPFSGRSEGELFQYLFTIQSNVLRDWYDTHMNAARRSVKREQNIQAFNQALTESLDGFANLADNQISVSEQAARDEEARKRVEKLSEAITTLPEREREAMTLRFVNGKSLAEIGETMGITKFAAGSLITRAVARIRASRPDTSG